MNIFFTILIALGLLFLSAAFSGLNIGLMMVRPDELRRKMRQGDVVAKRVYRYRKNGNYLIVCVLLGNVSVISVLTLVLDGLTDRFMTGIIGTIIAGVASTLLVTALGEILPQSLFSQRGWRLTRHFFWLLDIIFVLFWPLAYPVSKLLDAWVGKELPALYSREEFAHMIHEHAQHEQSEIDHDESQIIAGALHFSEKTVADIMTPLKNVFHIPLNDEIDAFMIGRLKRAGHSRIPVKDNGQFVGLLYTKDILGRDIPLPVSHVFRDKIHDIDAHSRLDTALSRFIQTRSHLFVVVDENDAQVGIITLEDVIEEILNREIEDEFDNEL